MNSVDKCPYLKVIKMIQKNEIVIGYYRQGKSLRQICRETGLHRRTVKRYVAAYEQEKRSGTQDTSVPKYNAAGRIRYRLNTDICQLIDECLAKNAEKSATRMKKQRMKKIDIHEYLLSKGHMIGYTTVCNYVRMKESSGGEVFIKQSYGPGQSIEFDWGQVKLTIDGVCYTMMLAVFVSNYSGYRWACLFHKQDMASFCESHTRFFDHFGAVPDEIVYDNMRVAVANFSFDSKKKQATESLLSLSSHYQFQYRFCNAYKGNEKGTVERSVEYVRRKSFCMTDTFETLEQANIHLSQTCQKLNDRKALGREQTAAVLAQEEKLKMIPARETYDTGVLTRLYFDKYHCVSIDTNSYSIPESVHGKYVDVKLYTDRFVIYSHQGEAIAERRRISGSQGWSILIEDYLGELAKKPGAVKRSLALEQSQAWIKELYGKHFEGYEKDFIALLQYRKTHEIADGIFRKAVAEALAMSPLGIIRQEVVKVILEKYRQQGKPASEEPQSVQTQEIEEYCTAMLSSHQNLFQTPISPIQP